MKVADGVAAVLSAGIVAYAAVRACVLSITIDEALTWSWHLPAEWHEIVLFQTPGEPDNNHMRFTLLAKLSVACFGLSAFTLRLPPLLGFAIFLGAIHLMLRRLVPGWAQVIGI